MDFTYTYNTWSQIAEGEVRKRYRFARLWVRVNPIQRKKAPVNLVGVNSEGEIDGRPPYALRHITESTDPLKLLSMELEHFIFEFDSFQKYLEGAFRE